MKRKLVIFSVWLIAALCDVAPAGASITFTGMQQRVPIKYKVSKPLNLKGVSNKTITGLDITGNAADCITLSECANITIKNCRLRFSKKNGITLLTCRNINVIDCYFEELASGVYAVECSNIRIVYNWFRNIQGPFPRGQMVQFDAVSGAGNQINYNKGENQPGKSAPEDAINVFKSNGTQASPIQVIGNHIRGGGPSKAGGGIMLGDNGGSYIIAKNNILVNPGQYGIAIAGGTNISILNNIVYARRQPFTNVGIYVWNQHPSACALNQVRDNRVNWTNAAGENNPGWNPGNCGTVDGWDTNKWAAPIDSTVLQKNLSSRPGS